MSFCIILDVGEVEIPGTRFAPLKSFGNSVEGKIAVAKHFLESGKTYGEYGSAHSIAVSTLKDWVKKYRQMLLTKVNTFHVKRGRPRAIDQEGINSIVQTLVEASEQQKTLGKRDVRRVVWEKAEEIKRRRNTAAPATKLSSKTVTRYLDEISDSLDEKGLIPQQTKSGTDLSLT
eukprot:scaffold918_cov168-Ochromonas_danica.AAC.3